MGEVLAKAIGDPVARMWHDACVYCCDASECQSGCGSVTCRCVTHAHDEKETEINELHTESA